MGIKKFKVSLIYIIFLVVASAFHSYLENLFLNISAIKFVLYLIYGLFFSFFLAIFVKSIMAGKNLEIAIVLLTMGLIFFFLSLKPIFLFKLGILEFFLLGVLISIDNKKSKSILPFFFLFVTALLVEIVPNLFAGTSFYYNDVWILSLTGLSSYIAVFILL